MSIWAFAGHQAGPWARSWPNGVDEHERPAGTGDRGPRIVGRGDWSDRPANDRALEVFVHGALCVRIVANADVRRSAAQRRELTGPVCRRQG